MFSWLKNRFRSSTLDHKGSHPDTTLSNNNNNNREGTDDSDLDDKPKQAVATKSFFRNLDQKKVLIGVALFGAIVSVLLIIFVVLFIKEKRKNVTINKPKPSGSSHVVPSNGPSPSLVSSNNKKVTWDTASVRKSDNLNDSSHVQQREPEGENKTIKNVNDDVVFAGFKLDGRNVWVNFSEIYQPASPAHVLKYEFHIKPKTTGCIASCRVGQRGWSLSIDEEDNRLAFRFDNKVLKCRESEQLGIARTYAIDYAYESLKLFRDGVEVGRGRFMELQGAGPLLLGMTLKGIRKNDNETRKHVVSSALQAIEYRPADLLRGTVYGCKFQVNGQLLGLFRFKRNSTQEKDERGRAFVLRDAFEFVFRGDKQQQEEEL